MLKTLRLILGILILSLFVYRSVFENFNYSSYLTFLLFGFLMLVIGLEEFQKEKGRFWWGYTCIVASIFVFLVLYKFFYLF